MSYQNFSLYQIVLRCSRERETKRILEKINFFWSWASLYSHYRTYIVFFILCFPSYTLEYHTLESNRPLEDKSSLKSNNMTFFKKKKSH